MPFPGSSFWRHCRRVAKAFRRPDPRHRAVGALGPRIVLTDMIWITFESEIGRLARAEPGVTD
ncbi:hypothetical protein Pen02_66030 [Plantactinospora endophytica]|uniref:Uncharacterized protein n=1 Tax=Plantactinospora endophytica TaxID=673535 RepID=A0ABQ4EBM3_9ACTN|nr:hypothetical protein Pen02_66030 [Plantactinospora endophytica]